MLATPHSLHADQIVRVAAAGKPVFCEKPLALKRADAERAVAAVKKAGVPIGVGQNKRFWPSMVELRRVVASGALGRVMHIEGHYSNENSGMHFSAWRDSPERISGRRHDRHRHPPARRLRQHRRTGGRSQCAGRHPPHRPRSARRGLGDVPLRQRPLGYFGLVRASPIYWRVHVFGDEGSVEALGETEVVMRARGGKVGAARVSESGLDPAPRSTRSPTPSTGRAPYPITPAEMVNTIAAFEAIIRSMETGMPVSIK